MVENWMLPATDALKVHTKFALAPAAMFVIVAEFIIEAFPTPCTTGVTGSTELASAPPLFVTLMVTVMNCPTLTCAGADVNEAVSEAAPTILMLFEPTVLAVNVTPLAWSNPLADAENAIAPAPVAWYTQT